MRIKIGAMIMNSIKKAIDDGILFLCVANSARSQIAEALARKIFSPGICIQSGGSKPARVPPLAIEVMREIGIDISEYRSKSVSAVDMSHVGLVVALCADEVCPVLPVPSMRLHWFLPNPAISKPGEDDIDAFRKTRDDLERKIGMLYREYVSLPVRLNTRERKPVLSARAAFFTPFRLMHLIRGPVSAR